MLYKTSIIARIISYVSLGGALGIVLISGIAYVYMQSDALQSLWFFLSLTVPVFVLTVGILFVVLRRELIAPLQNFVLASQKLATGEFKLRQDEIREDEFGQLARTFNQVAVELQTREQTLREQKDALSHANTELEHSLAERGEALEKRDAELTKAMEDLVLSEKMAALGILLAGVTHEINTPLGAIRASADNIAEAQTTFRQQFPRLFSVLKTENDQRVFFELLEAIREPTAEKLPSREKRKLKKQLQETLNSQLNSDGADAVGAMLFDMGVRQADAFLPLLRHHDKQFIVETLSSLAQEYYNLSNIQLAVGRVNTIVAALKNYAHRKNLDKPIKANLIDGIETVLTLYHHQLKQGIDVQTFYQNIPEIDCYPDQLNQVWTNLVNNAIDAMEGTGNLEIHVQQEDDMIRVDVADNGTGIPEDIQDSIFQPFFTTKEAGRGSGLGLDLSRKIVDKHQGRITVESIPGRTVFSVFLPLKQDA
jgi:signal transduction histidine kinase